MDVAEAQKVIDQDKAARLKAAADEYNEIVKNWSQKHNARLLVEGSFSGSSCKPTIQIVLEE